MAKLITLLFALLLLGCKSDAGNSCKAFGHSTTKVNFKIQEHLSNIYLTCSNNACDRHYADEHNITVTKTATGTLAAWSRAPRKAYDDIYEIYDLYPEYEQLEAELDTGAWQDFIGTLCSLANDMKNNNMEKEHNGSSETEYGNKEWVVNVYSYDKHNPYKFKSAASNFDPFSAEQNEKLEEAYKSPIFDRLKEAISYGYKKASDNFKEKDGHGKYDIIDYYDPKLIEIINKNRDYGSYRIKATDNEFVIDIYSSDKDKPERFKSAASNFDGFEKLIDGIKAKIKEKTLLKKAEAENKLRAEYQKRFGEPITEAELSTTYIDFWDNLGYDSYYSYYTKDEPTYRIGVIRYITDTTAKAEILPENLREDKPGLKTVEISIGEWLDFVRALHKCTDKWGHRYSSSSCNPGECRTTWIFRTTHSYIYDGTEQQFKYKEVSFDGNYKPKNWAEFMEIIDGMKARIKEGAERQQ